MTSKCNMILNWILFPETTLVMENLKELCGLDGNFRSMLNFKNLTVVLWLHRRIFFLRKRVLKW